MQEGIEYYLRDYRQKALEFRLLDEKIQTAKQAGEYDYRPGLWADLMRNDEIHKENVKTYLEPVLVCAREGNWPGVDFTLPQFTKAESKRLDARAAIMERAHIEVYSGDPTLWKTEHALWQELFDLLQAFLKTGEEREQQLVDAVNKATTAEESRNAHFYLTIFRQHTGIVIHHYTWLISWATKEGREQKYGKDPMAAAYH